MFLLKNNFVFPLDRLQSKTLLTINEHGSNIAKTSVFDCYLSPAGQLIHLKTLFIYIFGLRLSIVLTFSIAAYQVWFCCTLHDFTVDISSYN